MNAAAHTENANPADDIPVLMDRLGRDAAAASVVLAMAGTATKNGALAAAATSLRARKAELLAANARDMEAARAKGLSGAMLDRPIQSMRVRTSMGSPNRIGAR